MGSGLCRAVFRSASPLRARASTTGPTWSRASAIRPQNQSLASWFNNIAPGQPGAAFALPPPYTYGNVSRTLPDINGPRYFDVDASLFKDFPLRERLKLQFRAEAYNLTNTPSFSVPVASVTSATFGQVTSTSNGGPLHYRELQLALRLSF